MNLGAAIPQAISVRAITEAAEAAIAAAAAVKYATALKDRFLAMYVAMELPTRPATNLRRLTVNVAA